MSPGKYISFINYFSIECIWLIVCVCAWRALKLELQKDVAIQLEGKESNLAPLEMLLTTESSLKSSAVFPEVTQHVH